MENPRKLTPSAAESLLSNIVLDELDKELERRGHSYVRYADDVKIFVSSSVRAKDVRISITKYITEKLKLKVNESKSIKLYVKGSFGNYLPG